MGVNEKYFCKRCGNQLNNIDEIALGICTNCKGKILTSSNTDKFYCEICDKQLKSMNEKAMGICENCKASILRKLK